ncbi:MAG TPA: DUF4013 domain-containing protein [Thermoanaerobaculia bacterium]|jgi:hypothetical protein|nr:DUF4013 domain-containing protein [Thermoanaerobaculia bacterium]
MSDALSLPPPPEPPSESKQPQFDFAKPFSYVFDDPDWVTKILIGGLFYIAGFLIIGWFFILGYVAKTARNIIADQARPLPEWENLGDFFNEGLRLFGVMLVIVLPMVALAVGIMIPAGILGSVDNEGVAALGSLMSGCIVCIFVPISLAVWFFMPGMLLFAAVEQRFGAAFEFRRIWPFIKQNIGNYLLALVVMIIARFLGGFGIMLLCIGVVFTGFWSFLITAHGFAQVYRLATQPKP